MVTLVGSSCTDGDQAEADVVVIGADLELSGAGAELGTVYRNALELRVEQVNDQGLLGDRRLELDIRDNRSDGGTAATNVAELASDPDVDAIITGGCSSCAVAVAEAANDLAVPIIALAGPAAVSEPIDERQYMFKLGPNAPHTAAVLVGEFESNNVDTIGLVAVDDAYGEDGASAMVASAARGGAEIVVQETITPGEQSVANAAAAIVNYQPPEDPVTGLPEDGDDQAQQGPDAVVVWAPTSLAADFVAGLRGAGYKGALYLDAAAADNLFLAGERANLLDGATMIFTETLVIDEVIATSPARAARKNWFGDYSAEFGSYDAFSSFAADAIQLVVNAINQADRTDREVLRSVIETTQMEGFTGTIRMSPRQHSGLMPQALVPLVARGDRWRLG